MTLLPIIFNSFFNAAAEFIDQINPQYNTDNHDHHLKMFVHCAVGKSRSATVVIQYLITRGVDFSNTQWLQKIETFGLIDNFVRDDRIYRRSLQCFNIDSIFCCNCCLGCLSCCWGCKCCNETSALQDHVLLASRDNDDMKEIECVDIDKYKDWKAVSDIGTMSYRNSCDYVQKCREIVCPNQSFATQLAEYEESVRNGVSTYQLCHAWKHNYGFAPKRSYQYREDPINKK
eukprot:632570_1